MINLNIFNQTNKKINNALFHKVAKEVFKVLKISNAKLNLIFFDAEQIHFLNKNYRGKDKPTDVLSFENKKAKGFVEVKEKGSKHFIGELFICLPVAETQAKNKNWPVSKELTVLFTHGILHLVGYDHEKNEKDAEFTTKTENLILNSIF